MGMNVERMEAAMARAGEALVRERAAWIQMGVLGRGEGGDLSRAELVQVFENQLQDEAEKLAAMTGLGWWAMIDQKVLGEILGDAVKN